MVKSWTVHLVRAEQSDDSEGRIIFRPAEPTRGWVKIQVQADTKTSFQSSLSFDTGRGFHPEQIIHLHFSDGFAEQIIYFPQLVEQFGLDECSAGYIEVIATPLPQWAVTWAALRRNFRLALRSDARRRPSILIGLKLLATGQFVRFFRQLRINANPESIEEKQYENWMHRHERVTERIQQLTHRTDLQNGPAISVILLFDRESESDIRPAIESVLRQTYVRWELWMPSHAIKIDDERIKKLAMPEADPANFLNAALEKVNGDFLVLLQPNGQLAQHALHVLVEAIIKQPDLNMLYSDEDVLDSKGNRRDAFFKPDLSPEYLLSSMYIGQLAAYRTALVRQVGGFQAEDSDAWDYDLALRITEKTSAIVHVPEILFHRHAEVHRELTRDIRVLEAHLQSIGQSTTVHISPHGEAHEVRYPLVGRPLVSIIMASACKLVTIPKTLSSEDSREGYWALHSLRAIRDRAMYDRVEIILLTPAAIDRELADALDALGVIRHAYSQPFNFSVVTNLAAALSQGEHLLLLNDDTELISPDFIERMLSFSQQPEIGAVGAKLLYGDGTIQHAGIVMPGCSPGHPFHDKPRYSGGYHGSAQVHRNFLAVTAACMMTRRSVFNELNGFDESFHMNYNDVDYCLRAVQKGYRIVYQPAAELYHHESMSKPPIQRSELRAFQKRWASIYRDDPFYNRNFQPEYCDYVLRS